MVKYANSLKEAKKVALAMQKEEPEYAEDVRIQVTESTDGSGNKDSGIYDAPYEYVIHNETE